jgi:glyoxylase I family protein
VVQEMDNEFSTTDRVIVERLDHVAIIVTDVDRARAFYRDVLGLLEIPRPRSFDFPGAWFQAGPEVVHLLGHSAPDAPGRRHLCLWVADVHAGARYLAARGLPVRWDSKYKIDGVDRFFTEDPDGNRIEIQGVERSG